MKDEFTSREMLILHDKRLSEQDHRITDGQKSTANIEKELKQLIERINMGVSPTQNKILEKSNAIELRLNDLDHKIEISINKLQSTMDRDLNAIRTEQDSQKEWFDNAKTLFIRGILIVLVGAITLTVYNKVVPDSPVKTERKSKN